MSYRETIYDPASYAICAVSAEDEGNYAGLGEGGSCPACANPPAALSAAQAGAAPGRHDGAVHRSYRETI